MSKTAEIITGIAFFLFHFVVFTYCLLEAWSCEDNYIFLRFFVRSLTGSAWLVMAVLIGTACKVSGLFGIFFSIIELMIFLNLSKIPLFQDDFFKLCFILGMIYLLIATIVM